MSANTDTLLDKSSSSVHHVLETSDLLFLIMFWISEPKHFCGCLRVNKTFRKAALSKDLRIWMTCDEQSFRAFEPNASTGGHNKGIGKLVLSRIIVRSKTKQPVRWNCESVLKALRTKMLMELDLSGMQISTPQALILMLEALPDSLQCLSVRGETIQKRNLMCALHGTQRLCQLPNLRMLDLRGVLTTDTLDTLRRTFNARVGIFVTHGLASPIRARRLPCLERLAVGFDCHSPIGADQGLSFLMSQCEQSPHLGAISCVLSIGVHQLGTIDIHCGVCGQKLFDSVTNYIVHPPQRSHITYEVLLSRVKPSPCMLASLCSLDPYYFVPCMVCHWRADSHEYPARRQC